MKKGLKLLLGVFAMFALMVSVNAKTATIELSQKDFDNAKSEDAEVKALASAKGLNYGIGTYGGLEYNFASGAYLFTDDINLDTDETIMISSSAVVTFDLAGHSITQAEKDWSSLIMAEGDFTIMGNGSVVTACPVDDYCNASISATAGLTIVNGTFNGGIFIQNGNATINGGTFGPTTIGMYSTATINGGTFNNGISVSGAKKATINGGTFTGSNTGLMISTYDGIPELSISGGTFKATGKDAKSAILYLAFDTNKENSHDFSKDLAKGYKFSKEVETVTEDGESPGETFVYLKTNEISVVKEKTEIIVEAKDETVEDKTAKEAVTNIINDIIAGKEVKGVTEELQNIIKDAVETGKTLTIDVKIPTITEEKVNEDAKKVKELVGSDSKVAAYFDITVNVLINGENVGKITNVADGVKLTLPVPENLPAIPEGYTRTFTIVNVHNGVAKKLETTLNGNGTVTGTGVDFSTYAITYVDEKIKEEVKEEKEEITQETEKNPNTADNVMVSIIIAAISIIGLSSLIVSAKKEN